MSTIPLTEAEFIAREQAKSDKRWLAMLRRVQRYQHLPAVHIETLLVNGLIRLRGPSATCAYNHYVLTPQGAVKLQELARAEVDHNAKALEFIQAVARLTLDGECVTCHADGYDDNPACGKHEPFDMPNDDAVDTVARWSSDARKLLEAMK